LFRGARCGKGDRARVISNQRKLLQNRGVFRRKPGGRAVPSPAPDGGFAPWAASFEEIFSVRLFGLGKKPRAGFYVFRDLLPHSRQGKLLGPKKGVSGVPASWAYLACGGQESCDKRAKTWLDFLAWKRRHFPAGVLLHTAGAKHVLLHGIRGPLGGAAGRMVASRGRKKGGKKRLYVRRETGAEIHVGSFRGLDWLLWTRGGTGPPEGIFESRRFEITPRFGHSWVGSAGLPGKALFLGPRTEPSGENCRRKLSSITLLPARGHPAIVRAARARVGERSKKIPLLGGKLAPCAALMMPGRPAESPGGGNRNRLGSRWRGKFIKGESARSWGGGPPVPVFPRHFQGGGGPVPKGESVRPCRESSSIMGPVRAFSWAEK